MFDSALTADRVLAASPADIVPRLSEDVVPPLVIGTASLASAAMNGAGPEALASLIDQTDTDMAARFYDISIAFQLAFRRVEALSLQDVALAASPLLRLRHAGATPALRLMALVAPGDLMTNMPLDFLTNHLDVRLDLLFVLPGQPLPAMIPDHDVMIVATSDPDPATLARLRHLFEAWPRPVLNNPQTLPALARDLLSSRLAGVPGLCSPATAEVSRAALETMFAAGAIGELLPGCDYPVLLRPVGSHAGAGLQKVDSALAGLAYLAGASADDFYLTSFQDYRSADGMYRKYRIAFIDRRPYLGHMAVSADWMVHYLNAGMAESAEKRADEAEAMASFDRGFAVRHAAAFAALHACLPLDYYSIDCGELPDGRLVLFEADTVAIVHSMDAPDLFAYKRGPMRRLFDAFGAMLAAHAGHPRMVA